MTFGRILVILIMSLNLFLTVRKELKKNEPITIKRILNFILMPGIFPFGLFVYGYIYFYPEFYTFISWNLSADLVSKAFWLILASMIMNGFALHFFPDKTIVIDDKDSVEKIVNSDNRKRDAIITATTASLNAGFVEEMLFRFTGFFVMLVVINLFEYFIPFSITSFILLTPSWLTLGVEGMIPTIPFAALFLSNLIFAVVHLIGPDGKWNLAWTHRSVVAWFFGWVIVMALIQLGFAGAIFAHFLIDLILFVPLFVVRFEQITKKYWDKKYGPI